MSMPWPAIANELRHRREIATGPFRHAITGIEQLAVFIAQSCTELSLHGWLSMFELCIQQTDSAPCSGPYLRITPLPSGDVAFRYVDTLLAGKQWHRTVPADIVIARFRSFLDQLRWANNTTFPLSSCGVSMIGD